MPLYFFDVYDNGVLASDAFGIELVDALEARHQAIVLLPDMARDELPDGERHEFKSVVRDEAGRVLYVAKLKYKGRWETGARPADEPAAHAEAPDVDEALRQL